MPTSRHQPTAVSSQINSCDKDTCHEYNTGQNIGCVVKTLGGGQFHIALKPLWDHLDNTVIIK